MYAGTLSHFAQLQAQHELAALGAKVKMGLLAGKGIFGYEPKVNYLFGIPRSIGSGGIHLDIEMTNVVRALNNDNQKTIDFAIQTGPIGSALEHQVPEQMFNTDPNNPTQAISTVKALQLANAQGQKIYKIDTTNIDETLPKLNLSNTIKQDIQSSVNAGKYVITHTDNVSVPGWSGAGYAIIDPITGSDAYMISGGSNGGFISTQISVFLTIEFGLLQGTAKNSVKVFFSSSIFAGLSLASDVLDIMFQYNGEPECLRKLVVLATVKIVLALIPILFGPIGGIAIGLFSTIFGNLAIANASKYSCTK